MIFLIALVKDRGFFFPLTVPWCRSEEVVSVSTLILLLSGEPEDVISASLLAVKGEDGALFPFCHASFLPVPPPPWASPGARSFCHLIQFLTQQILTTSVWSLTLLDRVGEFTLVDREV